MRQPKKEYSKSDLLAVEQWARNGLTVAQIAKNMNISVRTFYARIKTQPKLKEALNSSRELADIVVENALYKSAIGFYVDTEIIDKNGNIQTIKKYIPPNVTAQIFWLKNRKPNEWREKHDIEVETVEKVKLVINNDL